MIEEDRRKPAHDVHAGPGAEVVVATAANEAEADMICARLATCGIGAEARRSIGGPEWGPAGARYVSVQPDVATRAKEILESSDGFSDDELARLSEQSAVDSRDRLAEREAAEPPSAPSTNKRGVWERLLQRMRSG